ncbi:kinesin-like protein Klp5 [Rhodotorula mucilaginosa]|uniref:Kinesin-like protein Klp5 n=1 Tax=Rhodotorula mucilaginosa TaxID=5537 RepID=A0A9P6W783_RHOMI|nr:kinesin-like protein Klp5 [Rhodotorula mucilaginosa]
MSSSISVAEKERLLLNSNHDAGPALFNSDNAAASTSTGPPIYSTPQPARGPGSLRKVLKVLDERILVFDPPETNAVASFHKANMPMQGKKTKDIRFCFDRVFDEDCGQEEVYDGSAKELVGHVMDGFHSTVFAYGTHTISGSSAQPGIVFLIMKDLFARIASRSDEVDFSLTVSYLEIYNETIRDLLAPESGILQLRDSQEGMATPANLSTKEPTCAHDVVEWITLGNNNRTVNFTEANATSSRSHAVLRVTVTQKPKGGGLTDTSTSACLSVIDLAGSERASVTKNRGERLNEGANINRSLLALGNCINALCDPRKRGHVPYRDSKLTRLLKQSLGGNCKTVMIVCVSPSSAHYDETHNTLQYANRAKEIKTKAIRNVISVDRHVAQYCQQIMEQQQLIDNLKRQLAQQNTQSAIADRADDERALQAALKAVQAKWHDLAPRREAAECAKFEASFKQRVLSVLLDWQRSVRDSLAADTTLGSSTSAIRVEAECDALVADFTSRCAPSSVDSAACAQAADAYTRAVEAARSQLASRPSALACFQAEIKALDARLDLAYSSSLPQLAAKNTALQAQAISGLAGILGQLLAKAGPELSADPSSASSPLRLVVALDQANRAAFAAFGGEVVSSTAFSLKRDIDSRSLNSSDSGSSSLRAAVGSAGLQNGVGRPRRSPKKPVTFLGSRSSPERKKAKTVQWSDDVGEELECVKYNSPDVSSGSSASSASMPPVSPRITTQMWTAPSTFAAGSDSSRAAEMMALKASTAMRAASKPLSTRAPGLAPVAESPSTFSLLQDETMPPPPLPASASAPRSPFADLANSSFAKSENSFSMAPSSSGLVAPLVSKPAGPSLAPPTPSFKHRRTSHIGPMRSEKAIRRLSVGTRPRTSVLPSVAAADTSITSSSSSATSMNAMRRPARLPSSASTLAVPSLNLPPASARKSPRKLVTRARPSMQPSSRRLSTMPTGAAAMAGIQPTTAAPIIFGGKSAARIAARRESRLSGGNSSGSGSTILANLPHATPASGTSSVLSHKRESPTGSAWR